MKLLIFVLLFLVSLLSPSTGNTSESVNQNNKTSPAADKPEAEEIRKVNGGEAIARKPVDFAPLYKVRERMDTNIKSSVDYLK